uniref:SART-1 family protein DOT2 n=1 Tax=Erigeron canadensis TaxID=72917 RepID=UPI001CB89610|nr:SART-1 family protein DOT2 [Erigeron canadensis]
MDMERSSRQRGRSVETRDQDESPLGERWKGEYDDVENDKSRESKHRSKEKSRSSRREEKDHRSRDREKSKVSEASKERDRESKGSLKDGGRDRRKEDGDDRDKERTRDDRDRERTRDRVREKENDREKYRDRERAKDKDREKGSDKGKEKIREKEREKTKDREKDRDTHGDKDKDRDRERIRERERDKVTRKQHDESHDRTKDSGKDVVDSDSEEGQYKDTSKHGTGSHRDSDDNHTFKNEAKTVGDHGGSQPSASELEDRIKRMKEERMKKELEDPSDVLSWVSKSRKLEKKKAMQFSKMLEEQDNQGDDEDEPLARQHTSRDLAGFKILDGLDKVIEGGAVVLTLKDQSILADGDINEEIDMLENVEIGEQKRRNEAYKAAKKKTGVDDDKFNEDPGFEKKMLSQYDDPVVNEGVVLDESGRFSGEAEKKLEELRKRIDGVSVTTRFEDLTSTGKVSTDYYTSEEMMKFKKPKKKKSLRKKDKLDIEALEAEARSAGLGAGDRGSRADGQRQAQKEKQERSEAEMRSNAFQSAYIKADEASKALRMEQTVAVQNEDEDTLVFGDDDEDLRKSLQRARKVALKQQENGTSSGPQAIALLASSTSSKADAENVELQENKESQENKVVFTEMEEFVWGLQLDEEAHNPDAEDVFMEEDVAPPSSDQELKGKDGVWEEVKDTIQDETMADELQDVKPDDTIHESSLGKGLAGALQLLKERGTLKDTVEWGGRNMDKKKSKLVGLVNENDDKKEIRIERTDEYGRILTPKEAFRLISHKFHGKGPGKMKQEKRMRQYHEELKVKQMRNADTPSMSVERMREAQSKMKTPYLVLSGHVKSGQTSDPKSGFATMEDFPGSLTPMLGDRKVEHFLGIKRKSGPGDMGPPKKPKT